MRKSRGEQQALVIQQDSALHEGTGGIEFCGVVIGVHVVGQS